MEQSRFLPNMQNFQDCEEKRRVEGLSQKLELHLQNVTSDKKFDEIQKLHEEANEIWWEINSTMGSLVARKIQESKQDKRWMISLTVSIIAIVLSLLSFIIRMKV